MAANERFGEIESVKATSDLYTGVAGEVVEVNDALNEEPGLINADPFETGWMVKLKMADPADLDALLDAKAYDEASGH